MNIYKTNVSNVIFLILTNTFFYKNVWDYDSSSETKANLACYEFQELFFFATHSESQQIDTRLLKYCQKEH